MTVDSVLLFVLLPVTPLDVLPHCDFQAEYAYVHKVDQYAGKEEVCIYFLRLSSEGKSLLISLD